MPYVIISTVALLSNLYKNAPLIVGDKDSDPELMRYLGARITTNYPACGSPPMYVMHAPPRTVFDNLEKKGYCLMSAQIIQEHSVWILARPRVPDDDKVEISRGGPNDKSIQAFFEDDKPFSRTTSPITTNTRNSKCISKTYHRVQVASPLDSLPLKSKNRRENVTVSNKGDGIAEWLGSEKVHERIQVSSSDVSVRNASGVPRTATRSTLERKQKGPSAITLERKRKEASPIALESKQKEPFAISLERIKMKASTSTVERKQNERSPSNAERKRNEVSTSTVEGKQKERSPSNVEHKRKDASTSTVERKQEEASSSPVECKKKEPCDRNLERNQKEISAITLEYIEINASTSTVNPKQIEASSSTVEGKQNEVSSSTVESKPNEASISAVESKPNEASSSTVESEQNEASSSTVECKWKEASTSTADGSQKEPSTRTVESEQKESSTSTVERSQKESPIGTEERSQKESSSSTVEGSQKESSTSTEERSQKESYATTVKRKQKEPSSVNLEYIEMKASTITVERKQKKPSTGNVERSLKECFTKHYVLVENWAQTSTIAQDVKEEKKSDLVPKTRTFVSKGAQADWSAQTLVYDDQWGTNYAGSGTSFYYSAEEAKKKFDNEKPLMIESFTQVSEKDMDSVSTPLESVQSIYSTPVGSKIQEEQDTKEPLLMKDSFIFNGPCGPCGPPPIALLENPFLMDRTHLACLTHCDNCCCEDI